MGDAAAAVVLGSLDAGELASEERQFFLQESPAGVTLFARNLPPDSEPGALTALVRELQGLRRRGEAPYLIAIDQEGGRVSRLKAPFPNQGPALYLQGGRGDELALAAIRTYGQQVGEELRGLGINVNFAPVVDILSPESSPAIGDRAFASSPDLVAARAGAFLLGLQEAGVFGCLKHFPGQGAARVDTHIGGAVIDRSCQDLQAWELRPYHLLHHQAPMIMVNHCLYPQVDPLREAVLSPLFMQKWLREDIGFQGLVVSDDMTMGAITCKPGEWAESLVEALAQGVDLLLVCRGLAAWQEALAALRRQAARSGAFRCRLEDAASRVGALRSRLGRQGLA